MISLKELSNRFESGLNAELKTVLKSEEIQFKIWAEAGQFQKPLRDGNTITYFINGNLRTSSSANDANDLVMGVNGLTLDFAIPTRPPRTNSSQTAADLEKIYDGQYPFVQAVTEAINNYFQTAQSLPPMNDDEGTQFSVSFQAGTSISGTVDILPAIGECITVNVYIDVYFIEGGTNSKDVKITLDGKNMPYKELRLGRAPVVERDVYAGENVSKCLTSSTVFTIDAAFPSSDNPATKTALSYVLEGEPNMVHFLKVKWGNDAEKLYLMTYNSVQNTAVGINIAGVQASFMEVADNCNVYNLPAGFQLGKFTFVNSSENVELSFTVSEKCCAFIAGVGAFEVSGSATVKLTPNSFEYDTGKNVYNVYMITDKAVTITNASVQFEEVKGGI